jgi:hypothetical protein
VSPAHRRALAVWLVGSALSVTAAAVAPRAALPMALAAGLAFGAATARRRAGRRRAGG